MKNEKLFVYAYNGMVMWAMDDEKKAIEQFDSEVFYMRHLAPEDPTELIIDKTTHVLAEHRGVKFEHRLFEIFLNANIQGENS